MLSHSWRLYTGGSLSVAVLGLLSIALLAGSRLLTGCNQNSTKETVTGKRRVAIISPAKLSEFNTELPEAADAEAKKAGWSPIIDESPLSEANDDTLVKLAEDALVQKPDAISVCNMSDAALSKVVMEANAKGIPIFIHNRFTPISGPGEVVAYIGYDEHEAGRQCGERAVTLLKQKNRDFKGQIAILEGTPGEHTRQRVEGFREAVAKYTQVQIVVEKNADWHQEEAMKVTTEWLAKYPKLDLIFACNDEMAQGASQAAYEATPRRSLFCIGFGGTRQAEIDVRSGNLAATIALEPEKIGSKIIDVMQDYLADPSSLHKGQVIPTNITLVDSSNIDAFMGGFQEYKPDENKSGDSNSDKSDSKGDSKTSNN